MWNFLGDSPLSIIEVFRLSAKFSAVENPLAIKLANGIPVIICVDFCGGKMTRHVNGFVSI